MAGITCVFAQRKDSGTKVGFLAAGRRIPWTVGGASIAASWIWAPALFVSVQMAFQLGLPGLFWFTFPNILALAVFAFLAPKIREKMPEGYTLPQWILHRLKSEKVHKVYLFPYFFYQLMAVTVQVFAGGNILTLLTGIPLLTSMVLISVIALSYSLISGLRASITTDFIQMALIFVGIIVIIPWVIGAAGGPDSVLDGLGGESGAYTNLFDPGVAFSFGIVTAVGLIAGAISDQQYWQRSFAVKKTDLRKAFIVGALLFGIVPLALAPLGFLGANPALGVELEEGVDVSMIGVATVGTLLPSWALVLFVVVLLAGLSSTLDSGLCAASSLYTVDVAKEKNEKKSVSAARKAMVGITLAGLGVAVAVMLVPEFGLKHLWWVFNTIAACVMVPTVLSLYWKKLSAKGVFWGVLTAFVVGIPLFVYGNLVEDPLLIVGASLFIVAVSTGFCWLFREK